MSWQLAGCSVSIATNVGGMVSWGLETTNLSSDKANRLDKMNLHLTACEIDKEYIDKAIKRISESIKQGTLSF